MANQRTATSVLEARGAFKRHPERRHARANEPVVVEALSIEPSEDTPIELHARWRKVVPLIPAGVAKACDAFIVEQLCALIEEFHSDPIGFPCSKHGEMRRVQGALGMTPADRSKVSAPQVEENEFDNL